MNNDASPLLSRVADAVYWMGRYIERAENVARFIGVNLHLHLDLPLEPGHQWHPLIATSGDADLFDERYDDSTAENVIQFLAFDTSYSNSICSCLRAARENARSIRDTISSEMWEQANGMHLQIQSQRTAVRYESLPEVLRGIRLACHMFHGITDATMSYNEAWHFLRLGKMMERADKTSRILDVKYYILLPSIARVGTPYDDLHWAAVLKSVSGFEMYRKKHGGISPRNIVQFLLMDSEFPRAVRHCIRSAQESLHAVTGTPVGSFQHDSEQAMLELSGGLNSTPVDKVIQDGLHEYLDTLQTKMNAVGDCVLKDFFIWRPTDLALSVGGRRG